MAVPRARRSALASALAGLLLLAWPATVPGLAQASATADAPVAPLVFDTKAGKKTVEVEIAQTDAQRETGLMYRRFLAPEHGMLFDFGTTQDVTMWMHNTYIPLDMVFVRADGTVHRVERQTTPLSDQFIPSGAPVRYVIELAGGEAAKLGIARGDKVEIPAAP
jgi:uncharacterized membrane protein (UPF0127 family)